jgi:hypothetical protein
VVLNDPRVHDVHTLLPATAAVPCAHGVHVAADVRPVCALKRPSGHAVHSATPATLSEKRPTGHVEHADAPAGEKEPAPHEAHTDELNDAAKRPDSHVMQTDDCDVFENVPGAHTVQRASPPGLASPRPHGVHVVLPRELTVPGSHVSHAPSSVYSPGAHENTPTGHAPVVQLKHALEPGALYSPTGHDVHVEARSMLKYPALQIWHDEAHADEYDPGEHASHQVLPNEAANVPALHETQAEREANENVPGAQSEQPAVLTPPVKRPAGQAVQLPTPSTDTVPAAHGLVVVGEHHDPLGHGSHELAPSAIW